MAERSTYIGNEIHLQSALRFMTPLQCHTGENIEILLKRKGVYKEAKHKHPERWTRGIRNWSAQEQVALNQMKEIVQQ